ncbi:MAG: hypothetical protein Q7V01_04265, partial [Vicinamibacterales bacterium]|nr:hypothetical protein [Vicinamibacterales bacterium]
MISSAVFSTRRSRRGSGRTWLALLAGTSVVLGSLMVVFAQEGPRPGLPLTTFQTADFSGSGT